MRKDDICFKRFAPAKESRRGYLSGLRLRASRGESAQLLYLGDGDFRAEIHVLNGIEELDAFFHGTLECLAAGDEAGASSALVNDCSGHGFFKVIGAGSAAAIDEAGATHVAVGDLIAGQVNGVIAGRSEDRRVRV